MGEEQDPHYVGLVVHLQRSLAPQHGNVDADDIYTRPLAIRMRYMRIYACAVLLIGGRADYPWFY